MYSFALSCMKIYQYARQVHHSCYFLPFCFCHMHLRPDDHVARALNEWLLVVPRLHGVLGLQTLIMHTALIPLKRSSYYNYKKQLLWYQNKLLYSNKKLAHTITKSTSTNKRGNTNRCKNTGQRKQPQVVGKLVAVCDADAMFSSSI